MDSNLWNQCIRQLEGQLSDQHLNTWIRPLQATVSDNGIQLLAPNRFVLDWVKDHYLPQIESALSQLTGRADFGVRLSIGSRQRTPSPAKPVDHAALLNELAPTARAGYEGSAIAAIVEQATDWEDTLNPEFTIDTFVEGKSNQLARAAAVQVGQNPGGAYNPLCIYGSTGLGKTHLMHAIGNLIREHNPKAQIAYLRAERFVADMVKALQHNAMDQFKARYRTLNALLIDDIQFFANKERTQEEFFHTFNALLENQQQIIFTSDKYPKEVEGVDERLKSRFSWGLTTSIDPPDTETRVAILQSKAEQFGIALSTDVAFFIANAVHSNVRELEGALRRVMANAHFMGAEITVPFVKDALKDLLAIQQKQVTIDNIQKVVSSYYKIRLVELLSSRRSRSIARPRQVAMALAKELTRHSYPEIGQAFGGRDHTTVIHACRKIAELRTTDTSIEDDVQTLRRLLTS
ncbi:MAG: chromosomal replication initiator protein DnaA [Gammaproteobacteria bacterium]|nr:chromosomal replication initiator protein DnaA [Gammaproteobacteria bacterium]